MRTSLKLDLFNKNKYRNQGVTPYGCEIDTTVYRYKIINGEETFTGFEYLGGSDKPLERKYNTKEDVISYWHNNTDLSKTFTDRVEELAEHYGIAYSTAHGWLSKCGIKADRTFDSNKPSKEELQALFNKHEGNVNAVRRELKISSWNQVKRWLDAADVKQVQTSPTKESDCDPVTLAEKQEPVKESIPKDMTGGINSEPQPEEEFQGASYVNHSNSTNTCPEDNNSIQGKLEPHNIMDELYINAKKLVSEVIKNDMALSMLKDLIKREAV